VGARDGGGDCPSIILMSVRAHGVTPSAYATAGMMLLRNQTWVGVAQ
jgi:hypothetical protein